MQLGRLVITVQPPLTVPADSAFGLTVAVEDAAGHLVTGYHGIVSVKLESNPGGSKLGGNPTAPSQMVSPRLPT